jgi:hypothetical protein
LPRFTCFPNRLIVHVALEFLHFPPSLLPALGNQFIGKQTARLNVLGELVLDPPDTIGIRLNAQSAVLDVEKDALARPKAQLLAHLRGDDDASVGAQAGLGMKS